MIKTYLVLLFLGHIIGDFYFQTDTMSNMKIKSMKCLCVHSLLYFLAMLIVLLPIWNSSYILVMLIISISHFLIDIIKVAVLKRKYNVHDSFNETRLFFADQILHAVVIIASSVYMLKHLPAVKFHESFSDAMNIFGLDCNFVISLTLLFLLNAKPYNIIIKRIIGKYITHTTQKSDSIKGTGAAIGTLERWIITIFFIIAQYSSIGLVLTAKSIARYNEIATEKDFAEYYLLGTLISTILAIVSAILII